MKRYLLGAVLGLAGLAFTSSADAHPFVRVRVGRPVVGGAVRVAGFAGRTTLRYTTRRFFPAYNTWGYYYPATASWYYWSPGQSAYFPFSYITQYPAVVVGP